MDGVKQKRKSHHFHMVFPLKLWRRLRRYSQENGKHVVAVVVKAVEEHLEYWGSIRDEEEER